MKPSDDAPHHPAEPAESERKSVDLDVEASSIGAASGDAEGGGGDRSGAAPVDPDRAEAIRRATAFIVKVGTRVLTTPSGELDRRRIDRLTEGIAAMAATGRPTFLVSSGAVAAGVAKMNLPERPNRLGALQAVAAIGQADLIQAYEASLARHGRHAAQVLLTSDDLSRRRSYLNVRGALAAIHAMGAIAVINENDSVAVSELQTTFGDNDTLAAQLGSTWSGSMLVILSDVAGLYDGPPDDPNSRVVPRVDVIDDSVRRLAVPHRSRSSKGGMASKLDAAAIGMAHGESTILAPGRVDDVLQRILRGESIGTWFVGRPGDVRGRRRWITASADMAGTIDVDDGAARAIVRHGKSLLAVGILRCEGRFERGDAVRVTHGGAEVARGLINYGDGDVRKIVGQPSERIGELLGHHPDDCVIHRDHLVLTGAAG